MDVLKSLISNYILDVAVLAWFIAQVLKVVLTYIPNKKINWERMVGAGGMPSSHSAFVCALAVGMAKKAGYTSPMFALTLGFAAVVMYDAMGVRRAAGEQAKAINRMTVDFKDLFQMLKEEFDALAFGGKEVGAPEDEAETPGKKLKEFLGHTPLEVFCGAVLGILIAVLIPAF